MDVISGSATYPEVSKVISKIKELSKRVWTLNATEIALEMGDPIFSNIVMLEPFVPSVSCPSIVKGSKRSSGIFCPHDCWRKNLKAFDKGGEAVQEI